MIEMLKKVIKLSDLLKIYDDLLKITISQMNFSRKNN